MHCVREEVIWTQILETLTTQTLRCRLYTFIVGISFRHRPQEHLQKRTEHLLPSERFLFGGMLFQRCMYVGKEKLLRGLNVTGERITVHRYIFFHDALWQGRLINSVEPGLWVSSVMGRWCWLGGGWGGGDELASTTHLSLLVYSIWRLWWCVFISQNVCCRYIFFKPKCEFLRLKNYTIVIKSYVAYFTVSCLLDLIGFEYSSSFVLYPTSG